QRDRADLMSDCIPLYGQPASATEPVKPELAVCALWVFSKVDESSPLCIRKRIRILRADCCSVAAICEFVFFARSADWATNQHAAPALMKLRLRPDAALADHLARCESIEREWRCERM